MELKTFQASGACSSSPKFNDLVSEFASLRDSLISLNSTMYSIIDRLEGQKPLEKGDETVSKSVPNGVYSDLVAQANEIGNEIFRLRSKINKLEEYV